MTVLALHALTLCWQRAEPQQHNAEFQDERAPDGIPRGGVLVPLPAEAPGTGKKRSALAI